ncbi:NYN domain-containing protein [Nocardioides ferulae]|uniref:NYN domain-containing protein n=1 Tax=Nocardioides ferulae TaxID=2340821 RepID=UPI000EAE856B|nr:NYN domain-containing protein [Nocardioides ferulae]
MASPDFTKLAVLIDADNTSPSVVEELLAEIAKYGTASVKRAYGDWTTPQLRGWKDVLNAHAIQPMQQFAYTTGKNSTDSALIIDAMDLLYTGDLDGFCLVSSDSDFTKLASRLRESGKPVYGFGERRTPEALRVACDKFVYLDVLRSSDKEREPSTDVPTTSAPSRRSTNELRGDARLVRLLREGVSASSDDDGWAHLGVVGSYVAKQSPDFDSRNWGYAKLVDLVTAIGLFEVSRQAGQGVLVREKPKGQASAKAGGDRLAGDKPAGDKPAAEKPADEPPTIKVTSKRTTSKRTAAKRAAAKKTAE